MSRLKDLRRISAITALALAMTFVGHFPAVGFEAALKTPMGLLLIYVTVMIGFTIAKVLPSKLPDLFWVSIIATAAGFPGVPGSAFYISQLSNLSLIATITPVLAFAGLALGKKDIDLFKAAGVQIVFISILVFLGTFLGSAVIAEAVLRLSGA
ncbi:MAG: hypothetical protein AAGC95_00535 [Pseudomonadota bacterium]